MEEVRKYENFTFNLKALKQARLDELSRMVLEMCATASENPEIIKKYEEHKNDLRISE